MKQIPKVPLGIYPTPLQEIPVKEVCCNEDIRLFLKREDLCGIGFGGNKVRKLEYILADALANGADSIVTGGGSQSNQTAALAACAAKLGLSAHLVIPESTGAITRGVILNDDWGYPIPPENMYIPYYHPISCKECGSRMRCNGCAKCGKCEERTHE